ncbi:MAG: hypothetical protein IPK68_04120 [Bdellovibrionales bacterium]|nr:hypothetical protein [Bdellovibrionales bacterium]
MKANVPVPYEGGTWQRIRRKVSKDIPNGLHLQVSCSNTKNEFWRVISVNSRWTMLYLHQIVSRSLGIVSASFQFSKSGQLINKELYVRTAFRGLGKGHSIRYRINDYEFHIEVVGTEFSFGTKSFPRIISAKGDALGAYQSPSDMDLAYDQYRYGNCNLGSLMQLMPDPSLASIEDIQQRLSNYRKSRKQASNT